MSMAKKIIGKSELVKQYIKTKYNDKTIVVFYINEDTDFDKMTNRYIFDENEMVDFLDAEIIIIKCSDYNNAVAVCDQFEPGGENGRPYGQVWINGNFEHENT